MCGRACLCIHLAHLHEWDFSIPPLPKSDSSFFFSFSSFFISWILSFFFILLILLCFLPIFHSLLFPFLTFLFSFLFSSFQTFFCFFINSSFSSFYLPPVLLIFLSFNLYWFFFFFISIIYFVSSVFGVHFIHTVLRVYKTKTKDRRSWCACSQKFCFDAITEAIFGLRLYTRYCRCIKRYLNKLSIGIRANIVLRDRKSTPHVTIFWKFWWQKLLKQRLNFNLSLLWWCRSRILFEIKASEQRHRLFNLACSPLRHTRPGPEFMRLRSTQIRIQHFLLFIWIMTKLLYSLN